MNVLTKSLVGLLSFLSAKKRRLAPTTRHLSGFDQGHQRHRFDIYQRHPQRAVAHFIRNQRRNHLLHILPADRMKVTLIEKIPMTKKLPSLLDGNDKICLDLTTPTEIKWPCGP